MNKREQWLIALGLLFAGGPVVAVLIYLILDPLDFSRPTTWFLALLLVVMFVWDAIAAKTYRPMLDRWLAHKSPFTNLFADEFENVFPFGLFVISFLIIHGDVSSTLGGSLPLTIGAVFATLIVVSNVWAAGRLYTKRWKKR